MFHLLCCECSEMRVDTQKAGACWLSSSAAQRKSIFLCYALLCKVYEFDNTLMLRN